MHFFTPFISVIAALKGQSNLFISVFASPERAKQSAFWIALSEISLALLEAPSVFPHERARCIPPRNKFAL